jgi:hypothetical protein
MHDNLKRFSEEGLLRDDSDFLRIKDEMTRVLEDQMRLAGYVPVLDINVQWSTAYEPENKRYRFKITVYGVYVGKNKQCDIIGFSDGKLMQVRTA